jgi:predicted permease
MAFRDFGRDLRLAVRTLTAARGFAVGVLASLTLGIVANTAAFSVVNASFFRPFPGVRDQHELVRVGIRQHTRLGADIRSTYDEFELLRTRLEGLEGLATIHRIEFAATFRGESSVVAGALVSSNYFDVLGARPAAGRFFGADEERSPHPVVVIGHGLWRRWFGEDPSAVGRSIVVNGTPLEIVGVAQPGFWGIHKGNFITDVWVPFGMAHLGLRDAQRRPVSMRSAGYLWLDHVGRRRPGASRGQVQAQAAAAAGAIDAARPPDRQNVSISVGRVWLNDPVRFAAAIATFLAVPLLVLVMACVNAANLLLARASRQARDWQLRLALGASRWRIVRQVLAECLLLATAAAVLGLALTRWILGVLGHVIPLPVPVDLRVQLFTVAAAIVTAVVFGLGPALHVATRAGVDARGLSPLAAGRSRSRVRFALIALQAALSLGLLSTGAQFINTVRNDFGRPEVDGADRLLIATFNLDPLNMQREAVEDFYRRLLDQVARLPGVGAAAVATPSLLMGVFERDARVRVWLPEQAPDAGAARLAARVSSDFFRTAGVQLRQGRVFTRDEQTGPVRAVIVNGSFARRYLGSNALNHTIRIAAGDGDYASGTDVVVVGVVGSEIGRSDEDDVPMLYYAAALAHAPARLLYIRFDDSRQFTLEALQAAVREVDYRVPIRDARTLRERRDGSDLERRLAANGVAVLGLFALTLAAGGLFGVVTYLVALRRREIGVRLALGASSASVVGLIVRQALLPTLVGALAGAGAAAAMGIVVRSRLYGTEPVNPLAFGSAALVLVATMALATLLPARHAARVDPMVVLREE